MRFLKTQRYPFVGKGQTVVNLVAVASGFGMLVSSACRRRFTRTGLTQELNSSLDMIKVSWQAS